MLINEVHLGRCDNRFEWWFDPVTVLDRVAGLRDGVYASGVLRSCICLSAISLVLYRKCIRVRL